ncbi:hypothetical protein F4782DRAFT_530887 [Xylaria castorea]|nr:hypothetical protein F4782DRAFT_530887 [Xylaria castorea]
MPRFTSTFQRQQSYILRPTTWFAFSPKAITALKSTKHHSCLRQDASDVALEYPHGHGILEAISPAIAAEAVYEFVSAASKYLSGLRSIFCANILKEAITKHDITKHKIDLLESRREGNYKYKKARDAVKKVIDAATNPKDDQTEKVDEARVERLLQCLHTVWIHVRRYFLELLMVRVVIMIWRKNMK